MIYGLLYIRIAFFYFNHFRSVLHIEKSPFLDHCRMSCSGHQTKLGSPPGKGNRNSTSETNMAKSPSAEIDNKTILFWKFFFVARIFHWARWSLLGFIFVNTALYCYFPDIQCIVCIFIYIYLPMFWLYNLIFSMTHVGKYTLYIQSLDQWCLLLFLFLLWADLYFFMFFFNLPLKLTAKAPENGGLEESISCQVKRPIFIILRKRNFWCLPVTLRSKWSKIDGLPIGKR